MGAPKPCLGYPSRTAAALAMRNLGLSNQRIADKIGISPATVGALISSKKSCKPETIRIDSAVLAKLRPIAAQRNTSVSQLCQQLLATIADDDLADAVLDDALELSEC